MTNRPDSDEITLAEAAERLEVHYMTAYRWVRTGLLDAHKVGGQWRVRVEDLVAPQRRQPGRRAEGAPPPSDELASVADRLAGRLVAGDEPAAWALVQEALAGGHGPSEVHVALIAEAMRVVGDRWSTGDVSIAQEHRASAVAARLVGRAGPLFRRPGPARATVLVAAAEGDRHALPVSLLSDVLRQRGLAAVDLGGDTPASEFVALLREHRAHGEPVDAVALCSTLTRNRHVAPLLADLRAAQPGLPLLLGGAGVRDAAHATRLGADAWTGRTALDAADAIEAAVAASDQRVRA